MVRSRSVPPSAVVPVLAHEDVARATAWLCLAVGFKVRLRIGDHRAQLPFGNGALIVIRGGRAGGDATEAVLVQVIADVDPASWGATSINLE